MSEEGPKLPDWLGEEAGLIIGHPDTLIHLSLPTRLKLASRFIAPGPDFSMEKDMVSFVRVRDLSGDRKLQLIANITSMLRKEE